METNYDRTQLLKTALEHTPITIEDLAARLHVTPIELYYNLEKEEANETIQAVSAVLGIPEAYFSGDFYYNDRGHLVPTGPE